jgi:4'-phosphopantetheinyl transferase
VSGALRAAPSHPPGFAIAWAEIPDGMLRREVAWSLLADLAGNPADLRLGNPCPRCGGPHGPVVMAGTRLRGSVAYAGRVAVAAVVTAEGLRGFGIDAEMRTDRVRDTAGWDGVPGPGARGTVRGWTRIEAALKADGRGLAVDPAAVSVRERPDGRWSAALPEREDLVEGWDVAAPAELVVSAAIVRHGSGGSAAVSIQR